MNSALSRERLYFSHAQLQCYLTCPLKYRYCYVDCLEPAFVPADLAFYAAMRESVAAFLRSTLEGDPLKPEQLLDIFRESWRACDGPVRFFDQGSDETLLRKARELLTIYHDSWDHEVKILAVAQPFEFDLRDYLPEYPDLSLFKGVLDSVVSMEGSVVIIGLKTSSRLLSKFHLDNNDQLTAYSIGAASQGFRPDKYRLDVLITAPKPDLVIYQTERGEHHQLRFLKTVSRIWKAIQASIFYPKPDWYCHTCQWQTYCEDW